MKNILLLGGFGFLGTNVTDYVSKFLSKEFRIIVFENKQNHPLGISPDGISKIYCGDFTDKMSLEAAFKENKIDYVFHFISSTVPSTSNKQILFDIDSNLKSTIQLLDLMVAYKVPNIIFISSGGAIYGNSVLQRIAEDQSNSPISSYGILKLTIEKYLLLYNYLYGVNYLSLRLANPYGPFHLSDKQGVINIALKKGLYNEIFEVWGNGTSTKDYIYIEDFTKILFLLIEKNISNEILNIGTGIGHSLNDILHLITQKEPGFQWYYTQKQKFDIQCIILDITKLQKLVEFNFTPLTEGIDKTFDWIKATYSLYNHKLLAGA